MIKLKNYTPEIYYKESRDFQFLGRLFDVVLNSVKTETDLLYNIPFSDNSDEKLLELLALTLGFKANKKYNAKQLRAICSVFPEVLKNKGSIKALQLACTALFSANGSRQELYYKFNDPNSKTVLTLYLPQDFEDIPLLTNLFTYILPAGLQCNLVKEIRQNETALTELSVLDSWTHYTQGEQLSGDSDKPRYFYDNNSLASIAQLDVPEDSENPLIQTDPKDTVGFISLGGVYRPENSQLSTEDTNVSTEEEINNG